MKKEQDSLHALFRETDPLYPPVDLEAPILEALQQEALRKKQVRRYRRYGLGGMLASVLLCGIYAWTMTQPAIGALFSKMSTQVGLTSLGLMILFLQWELGRKVIKLEGVGS